MYPNLSKNNCLTEIDYYQWAEVRKGENMAFQHRIVPFNNIGSL